MRRNRFVKWKEWNEEKTFLLFHKNSYFSSVFNIQKSAEEHLNDYIVIYKCGSGPNGFRNKIDSQKLIKIKKTILSKKFLDRWAPGPFRYKHEGFSHRICN